MKKLNRKEEEGDEGNIGSCYIVFTGRNMHSRGRKMQLVPCFGGVEIVLCLWITSAVLTLVASQQKFYIQGRYGKRQEPRTGERKSYMYIHIYIFTRNDRNPSVSRVVSFTVRFFLLTNG